MGEDKIDKDNLPTVGKSVTTGAEPLVKVKALLYLITGLMIVFTPWLLILGSYFGKTTPLFEQIMYFCAEIAAGILHMSPWAQEVFKKK